MVDAHPRIAAPMIKLLRIAKEFGCIPSQHIAQIYLTCNDVVNTTLQHKRTFNGSAAGIDAEYVKSSVRVCQTA